MADVIDELFTTEVLGRLKKHPAPSTMLAQRVDILSTVETPSAELNIRTWQRTLIARRAAWADYVTAMREAGLLDADVVARLTEINDDGFRSAVAECLTCHFLARVLRLPVFGRHEHESSRSTRSSAPFFGSGS
jgi:hypothetical protein